MFRLLSCERDVGLFDFVREEKRPVMPGRFAETVRINSDGSRLLLSSFYAMFIERFIYQKLNSFHHSADP